MPRMSSSSWCPQGTHLPLPPLLPERDTVHSGLTDASKRRFPDDDNQSWENVSCSAASVDQAIFVANMPEHVPVPPASKDGSNPVLRVMMEAMEDKKIPLPDGVIDLMTWGRMICETDKYKDAELSYFELVAMAKTDADVHSYLNFLLKRYGLKPGQAKHEKHTAGRDLAQFLQRYGWCGDNSDCTFQRRFK